MESVRPLNGKKKMLFRKFLPKRIRKQSLEIENQVNSDLFGGVKIQIGNRIYDGTLRGKLDRLKRELIGYQL